MSPTRWREAGPCRPKALLPALAVLAALAGLAGAQPQPSEDEVRRAPGAARAAAIAAAKAQEARPQAVRAVSQVWSDEQFEQGVFQNAGGGRPTPAALEARLASHVETIHRTCTLSVEQKEKIQLMGRGDIKRFFDGVEVAKERFRSVNNDIDRLQELLPAVNPLRLRLAAGLFSDGSLLSKALHSTLTAEQFARYETAERERLASEHRAFVEQTVTTLERILSLVPTQRRDLVALLTKETKPPRAPSRAVDWVMMFQLSRIPEAKLKPLFTDAQWQMLSRHLEEVRIVEPQLRLMGAIVDD